MYRPLSCYRLGFIPFCQYTQTCLEKEDLLSLPPPPSSQSLFRLADLNHQRPTAFDISPDANQRRQLSKQLGFRALRKLRLTGQLVASGKKNWALKAKLGATIEQDCVITLRPVITRVDSQLRRRFVPETDLAPMEDPMDEIEMDSDETLEPLPEEIDLLSVLAEALSIEAPDYPRAQGAALSETNFSQPGVAPMTDADAKPFSGLAKLQEKMQKDS